MKTSPRLLSLLSVIAFVAFVSVVTAAPIAKGPDATIDIRPTSRNAADAAKVLANLTEEEKAIIEILKNMNAETRELLTKATDTVLKNARKNAVAEAKRGTGSANIRAYGAAQNNGKRYYQYKGEQA